MIARLAINSAAVWLAVQLVNGLSFDGSWIALVVIAAVLGLINTYVRPVLKLLSFPVIILTLGLFLWIINAVALGLTITVSNRLDLGLTSEGFGSTLVGALVISIVTAVGESLRKKDR